MTALVRSIAVLGMLVFGTLLAFTWGMPAAVERHAAEFLRERVVAKTSARIEAAAARAGETRLGQLAQRVLKASDWQAIDTAFRLNRDPLFGGLSVVSGPVRRP